MLKALCCTLVCNKPLISRVGYIKKVICQTDLMVWNFQSISGDIGKNILNVTSHCISSTITFQTSTTTNSWISTIRSCWTLATTSLYNCPKSFSISSPHFFKNHPVATLALGSQPRQRGARVRAKRKPGSHIRDSRECRRV